MASRMRFMLYIVMKWKCSQCPITSRSGLVVKFVVAIDEPRVRFTAATSFCLFVPPFCLEGFHFAQLRVLRCLRSSTVPIPCFHCTFGTKFCVTFNWLICDVG